MSHEVRELVIPSQSNYLKTEPKVSGIDLRKDVQKWRAHIAINGQRIYLGMFDSREEALRARLDAEAIYGKPKRGVKLPKSRIIIDREIAFIECFSKHDQDAWAIIDIQDVPKIMGRRWFTDHGYAITNHCTYMHRVLMGEDNPLHIDHIDRNRLNNRKHNLRFATPSQNLHNSYRPRYGSSSTRGVSWDNRNERWIASITVEKQKHYLGSFKTMDEAARIRKEAEIKLGVNI